ncbi:hydrolase [Streptomyces aureoverticillatus]|nr:hydrolase [Streptomyces aureoverticillatus]
MTRTNPLLTPENSVLVLIDYQPEMFSLVRSMDTRLLELNTKMVVRAAQGMGVPVILTTVGVDMGVNQPTVHGLREELPGTTEFDRSTMNAWEDEAVREAVLETGRENIVFGALWTEICLAFPVVHAQADGHRTFFVTDIVGGTSPVAHETGIQRMVQAGSVPTSANALVSEWVRDWKFSPHADTARTIGRWYVDELAKLDAASRG